MKNKNLTFLKIAMVAVLGVATAMGCKKDEKSTTEVSSFNKQKTQQAKLLSFFAWSVQLPEDSIKFDNKTKEFYIVNTNLREKLSRVEEEYNKANIYHNEFEKK